MATAGRGCLCELQHINPLHVCYTVFMGNTVLTAYITICDKILSKKLGAG